MSCRWMPPSNGSFMTKTSPGCRSSPNFASSVFIACGTEPRWNGTVTPCATVSPFGSQIVEAGRVARCRRPEAREPERPDLDRRGRLAAHAVEPLVRVLEAGEQIVERLRQLDLDLPALAAVAEVGAADPLHTPAVERRREARLELVEDARDLGRVERTSVEVAGVDVVELRSREEQPERAEEAGERGYEHRPAAEVLGESEHMHGTGAAVRDQDEVARVA